VGPALTDEIGHGEGKEPEGKRLGNEI